MYGVVVVEFVEVCVCEVMGCVDDVNGMMVMCVMWMIDCVMLWV